MKIEIDDSKLVETIVKEVVEEIKLIGRVTFWTRLEPVYSKLHRLKWEVF
jgi:hypothetical protein